ncbi:hypothetical protein A2U01_0098296, partial [Trifolium medium]|nr:hypothetical protein [Trifolium medium]
RRLRTSRNCERRREEPDRLNYGGGKRQHLHDIVGGGKKQLMNDDGGRQHVYDDGGNLFDGGKKQHVNEDGGILGSE